MLFDEEYPHVPCGFRTEDGFRKGKRQMRCIVCQSPTPWFHEVICLYFCCREHRDEHLLQRKPPPS